MTVDRARSEAPAKRDGCVFCQILDRQSPASFVARESRVSAFMDINPVTPGHLLVVSNEHYVGLDDAPHELLRDVIDLAQRCSKAVRASNVRSEGINLFLADGAAAFQEVFHLHLHVVPRYRGDSFRIRADWNLDPSRAELDRTAEGIAVHLKG